jgi:hypothetical protein
MAGHANDRNVNICLRKLDLKVGAAEPRQPDIKHEAARHVRQLAAQEFIGLAEHLCPQVHRSKQVHKRIAHQSVVIDYKFFLHCAPINTLLQPS